MFKNLGMIACIVCTLALTGCMDEGTAGKEHALTEQNQQKLLNVQPPVRLDWSLEREQLNKRTKLWNDKNKVSYIYLVDYGRIMAYYVIKGKVSSVNSQITNPNQIAIRKTGQGNWNAGVIPSPAEDGSYGSNGDAVFFFTTDGTYVEWSGKYHLSDKPLKMTQEPLLVQEVND